MAKKSADLENFIWHYSRSQLQILGFIQLLVPSTNEAEDILQETSLVLLNKWSEFDQDRDFTKWACGVARYEVFKFLRKKRKHTGVSLELLEEMSDMALENIDKDRDQLRQDALAKCFDLLSPENQKLFQDRYRWNQTVAELAVIRKKSERAIYKNLNLVRKNLQKCIQRHVSETS